MRVGDVPAPVGAIEDVARSKELLGREKDREHLRLPRERWGVEGRWDLDLGGGLDLYISQGSVGSGRRQRYEHG